MSTNNLAINGRAFKSEPDGDFIVSRKQLRSYDLHLLPVGTRLSLDYGRNHRSSGIRVVSINVQNASGIDVLVDFWHCPNCWGHALSYSKFMLACEELLRQASRPSAIEFVDQFDEDDGIHILLSSTRSESTVEDLEAGHESEVDSIIAQLVNFTDQMDQQVRQQFHV